MLLEYYMECFMVVCKFPALWALKSAPISLVCTYWNKTRNYFCTEKNSALPRGVESISLPLSLARRPILLCHTIKLFFKSGVVCCADCLLAACVCAVYMHGCRLYSWARMVCVCVLWLTLAAGGDIYPHWQMAMLTTNKETHFTICDVVAHVRQFSDMAVAYLDIAKKRDVLLKHCGHT